LLGSFRLLPWSSPRQAPSFGWPQSVTGRPLFIPPGCDTGWIARPFRFRPSTAGTSPTTLAHSSNDRSATDCVRLRSSSTRRFGA
jgi:hypothetical protein